MLDGEGPITEGARTAPPRYARPRPRAGAHAKRAEKGYHRRKPATERNGYGKKKSMRKTRTSETPAERPETRLERRALYRRLLTGTDGGATSTVAPAPACPRPRAGKPGPISGSRRHHSRWRTGSYPRSLTGTHGRFDARRPIAPFRHARTCSGHPCGRLAGRKRLKEMPGTSPGMTGRRHESEVDAVGLMPGLASDHAPRACGS